MAILNFMPQFVPSYLKNLMKEQDDPDIEAAKEPSTGFFGGVFGYIDEAFEWTPAPEPTNPWNVANVGTQEVPFTPEPFMDPMLYDSAEWGTEPTGDFQSLGPIYGGMFGNIGDSFGNIGQDFIPPAPSFAPPGMPEATGWGFPDFPVPDPRWDYNPDTGGLGHFQALPPSYQTMDFSRFNVPAGPEAWGQVDDRRGMSFGEEFGNSLFAGLGGPSLSDVISGAAGMFGSEPVPPDLFGMGPQSSFDDRIGGSFADAIRTVSDQVSSGGAGPSPAWDQFIDLGSMVSDIVPQPRPYGMQDWGIPGMEQYAGNYELSPNWSMYGNSDVGLGMMPDYWAGMTPQQRGEQVYFSGGEGADYLTDADWEGMTPDLAQKIGYADSRISGGINNGFTSLWNNTGAPLVKIGNAALNIGADAIVDPILDPLTSTGNIWSPLQEGFWSEGPGIRLNLGGDPENVDWSLPLEDVVTDARTAENPWDFVEAQDQEFSERPLLQQIAIGLVTPGSGIYKNLSGAPAWLRSIDSIGDAIQGGTLLDNVSIPGSNRIVRDVIGPGVVGGGVGAATEAFIDPTYTDQWGNEYDPGMLESILGGSLLGIGGNAAIRSGTVPFGATIESTGDFVLPKALAGAKPSYGYGDKLFTLQFDDDLDKALYIVRNSAKKSASDEKFMGLLREYFPDLDDVAIRAKGEQVASTIKEAARTAPKPATKSAPLPVPAIIRNTPIAAADGAIETPAEALIRQQQEIFATDPVASRAFNRQVPTPEVSTVPPLSVADEIATPAPTVADSPVKPIIDQIDAQRQMNSASQVERERIWRARQADVRAEAVADATARGMSDRQAAEAGNAAVARFTIENPLGPLSVPQESIDEAFRIINSKPLRPGEASMATRVLRTWEQGKAPAMSELNTLRRILTGEDIIPSGSTIESVVTQAPGVTRAATRQAPEISGSTSEVSRIIDEAGGDANVPVDDILSTGMRESPNVPTNRGAFQTSLGSVDETGQFRSPGTPELPAEGPPRTRDPLWKASEGRSGGYPFSSTPATAAARQRSPEVIAVEEWSKRMTDEGAQVPFGQIDEFLDNELQKFIAENGPGVAPLARLERAKIPGNIQKASVSAWTKPFNEAIPEAPITDVGRAAPEDIAPPAGRDTVPAVARPVTDEWEQQALEAVRNKPMRDRADILDKMQFDLSRDLRKVIDEGAAANQAERARNRVNFAMKQQDKGLVTEAMNEWRRVNVPEFDEIKMFANTSWGERWVGGALKSKLADTMTQRGRDLVQWLENTGYTFDEAKEMVDNELGRYLEERTIREAQNGNKNALLEQALTKLHMGDFQPKIEGVTVPKGTGDVARWIEIGRTGNSALKGLFFSMADAGVILGTALPAIQAQWIPIGLGYLNQLLKLADIDDAKKFKAFSGLAMGSSQDIVDDKVGTVIGVLGRAAQNTPLGKAGDALVAIDKPFVKWNQFLEKTQFDWLMNKGLRQPAYDGNLVILKMLGRDINDPKVQRAAARMANAATATAPLARGNTRRGIEGASLTSARYLRAQGDLLLAATKLVNPKASMDERIIAGTAVLSILASAAAAHELVGERLNLDWKDPKNFGDLTLPDGTVMPYFNQKALAQTLAMSIDGLSKAVQGEGNIHGITDPIIKFMMNRQGPLPATGTRYAGIGFDPKTGEYSWPGRGPGFGSEFTGLEKLANAIPYPVGVSGFLKDNESTPLGQGLNVIGGNTYQQSQTIKALQAEGYKNWEEFEAKDPDTFSSRKAKFFNEHPELDQFDDTVPAKYREEKKKNSEEFMTSRTGQTVKAWRDENRDLGNNIEGAFAEMALENGERPEKDGSAQWVYDFNQTFVEARDEPLDPTSQMDMEALGELQAEFWAEHSDPKVRKEIMAYQMERAETEADKQWIASMARLNGFDPYTGKPLTYKRSGKPMPNYFEMDRYEWAVVPNDESRRFREKFEQWKLDQSAKVRELGTDKLIKMYIDTEPEVSTRENGEPWTAVAIRDVQNYGKPSKEDPVFIEYKEIMQPDLLWFKPGQYWDNIEAALEEKYGKVD